MNANFVFTKFLQSKKEMHSLMIQCIEIDIHKVDHGNLIYDKSWLFYKKPICGL